MTEQNISTSKRCETCKSELPVTAFSRNRSTRDGLSKGCKPCRKAHDKAHYEKNKERERAKRKADYQLKPEEYKARARRWEANNPDKKRGMRAAYRAANREKIKEFGKRDWERHKEKRRAQKKEYRAANPERGAEHVRARQTRKQKAMPEWADRDAIRAIYTECRRISLETGVKHHVDHYYPLKNDSVCGLHNEYNLRIIPATENQSKGNRKPL